MSKKGIRKALILCAAFMMFASSPRDSEASGFPTVDIAALIQRITSYVTQLQQYASQLTSNQTEIGQLMQLYADYEQTLREYDHYLSQLRGLERFIDPESWAVLLEASGAYYGRTDFALVPDIDARSENYERDVAALLNRFTTVPLATEELEDRLNRAGVSADVRLSDDGSRISAAFSRQIDLYRQVSQNERDAKVRDEDVRQTATLLRGIGDESDLATLQLLATQLQVALDQNQAAIRVLNQQLLNTELPSATRAADKAAMIDREISRLERVIDHPASSFTVENINDF